MALVYLSSPEKRKRLLVGACVIAVALMITAGVFAKNDWFPRTDAFNGQKYGWFGRKLPKNAASSWNPLAAPLPTATPQLSKEYIYAGSRLLAVEDTNANAVPPADLAVWRPNTGNGYAGWYVIGGTGSQQISQEWGLPTDSPVPGDYDGDGKTDFSVFRRADTTSEWAKWYVLRSSDNTAVVTEWGLGENVTYEDVPVQADYDGDGKTDIAVYRENDTVNGSPTWYIHNSSTGSQGMHSFGATGDKPAPADYDGDGKADRSVWRPGNTTFYSINSSNNGFYSTSWAYSGEFVSGDYDGDGKADIAVFGSAYTWYIRGSASGSLLTPHPWGLSGDKPVQNDYDGDGKCDIAVWRPSNGTWYIVNSGNGSYRTQAWGLNGDIPVPAYFRR